MINVALIRRKGVIAMDMPKDIMFMPEEKGGYGLTSMVDLVDRMRVEMYMQALNDYTIGEDGDEILSTQAHITQLSEGHREKRGTLGHSTGRSEERLGVSIQCNPTSIKTAAQRDLAAARKHPRHRDHGTLNIYTDGGTIPGTKPRTAWGLEIQDRQQKAVQWKGKGMQIHGRRQGLQSNDLGEAMALLQGLRSIHPSQDCEIFIDNTGVVDTWHKATLNDPRARLHSTGRALWNRIQLLKGARERAGAACGVSPPGLLLIHPELGV